MPVWGSFYFQNSLSPIMEQLIFFHDHVMVVLIVITVLIGYVLVVSVIRGFFHRSIFEGQEVESLWTVLPIIFLLVIAFPSLRLLYMMEEMEMPDMSVKSVGRQWYWVYEYSDFGVKSVESYMVPEGGDVICRLLEVDNCLVLPVETSIRMVITSGDVIHSWTVPVLGVSADGVPGRLNQVLLYMGRCGVFVGQCSEICGANHSFMPIVLSVISSMDFLDMW